MAGRVGILIAMGAIVGKCLLDSGAADRIIQFVVALFGKRLIPAALLSGGFVLSIPIFYDTTFYLLVPIVRSVYKQLQKNYILCLMSVGLGATLSHTLIPPTPGPVIVAETLGISLGTMMIISLMVGALTVLPALGIAFMMDRLVPNPAVHFEDEIFAQEEAPTEKEAATEVSPSLFWSFAPILVPVVLIAMQTTIEALEKTGQMIWSDDFLVLRNALRLLGDPRFAMILAAVVSMVLLFRTRKLTLSMLDKRIEHALIGGGMIILITAAGGAFGETLRQAGIGERIQELSRGGEGTGISGMGLLLLAFGTAALIKTAQGSSTTAIITTAGIFAGILNAAGSSPLPFHAAYLAIAIGLGSCVTGWMNDSGFWLFCRMGGIKETDALKTWTVGLVLLGLSGLVVVLILSWLLPLTTLP
jgi:GntP family gluconate:H+ symporter